MDQLSPDAAPAVLKNLIAAGLVSHEMIGDPDRLEGEAAALRALCRLVAGPVYRIDPYHYAFAPSAADMDGALAGLAPEAQGEALAARLAAELGDGAVWLTSTDLLPRPAAAAALEAPILLLRGYGAAAELAAAEPGVQAVVNARFAAETARLTATHAAAIAGGLVDAGAEVGRALEARLERLETALAGGIAALGARLAGLEAAAAPAPASGDLSRALAAVVQRLDAQSAALAAHVAREDLIAARLDELGRLTEALAEAGHAEAAGAQETIGLTLAEFLARLEPGLARPQPTEGPRRVAARELA